MRAESPEHNSSRRPATMLRHASNSLLRNILPATHSFSIFYRQTCPSNPSKPNKTRILLGTAEKNSSPIRPVATIASI
jgi:hypothetical protein